MWDTIIINPMLNALVLIYSGLTSLFGSEHMFGLAIILFTALIRFATLPLTASQQKSALAMQNMQQSKEWQEIQKKYKNDREKLAQEQMKLYQEMGVNPFSSCLPTLIQFPIIIGLYQSIQLAMADSPLPLLRLGQSLYGFIDAANVIPLNSHFLWMELGQPERVVVFGFGIPLLAILVTVSTFLQTRMMAQPTAPNSNDASASTMKMMNLYMPLMMGYLAFSFSSGIALYILVGNIISIIQYAIMGKLDWRRLIPGRSAAAS